MSLNLKIFVNAALTFAGIGFVTYIFIVITSFFGCCAAISEGLYYKIIIGLVVTAAVTFGFCLYNNCYKSFRKEKES